MSLSTFWRRVVTCATGISALTLGINCADGAVPPKPSPIASQSAAKQLPYAKVNAKSLLDEAGNMSFTVPASKIAEWKQSLSAGKSAVSLAPVYHLWLGECELSQEQNPQSALWHFAQVEKSEYSSRDLKGLARYDSAVATFNEGAYGQSTSAFWKLLTKKPAPAGVDRRRIALWYKEAASCAGYHNSRSRMGIPEPPKIDPECAAAGLADCLRALKLPYDHASVLKACKVTGEGSTLQDILDAGKTLNLSMHTFGADDTGLRKLPKPLIAYVEHDHFIAVEAADDTGVTYLCSDCGAWPGGRVHLTWKQWHAIEATIYVAVTRPDSGNDQMFAALEDGKVPDLPRLATTGTGKGILSPAQEWVITAHTLQSHIIKFHRPGTTGCGKKIKALHCPPFIHTPMVKGSNGSKGPTTCDPVNAATGEEEYTPEDLTVYNPTGPSIHWGRVYNSLRSESPDYNSADFGMGWSHNYNIGILVPETTAPQGIPIDLVSHTAQAVQLHASGLEPPADPVHTTWDIVQMKPVGNPMSDLYPNSVVVATSTTPNSWIVTRTGTNTSAIITVTPPSYMTQYGTFRIRCVGDAGATTGYSSPLYINYALTSATGVLFSYNQGSNGEYSVAASGTALPALNGGLQNNFIVMPNGGRISFQQANGICTPEAGAGVVIKWTSNGSGGGTYTVTFANQTKWTLSAAVPNSLTDLNPVSPQPYAKYYPLTQIKELPQNPININYTNVGGTGFPLISSITNQAGTALLTINRNTSGTYGTHNAILSVSDCYGRFISYGVLDHTWTNYARSSGELETVSQVGQVGQSTAPPTRYTYGYTLLSVLDGSSGEQAPFLTSITTPSENPNDIAHPTYTSTISYDPATDFIQTIQDANGNTTKFYQVAQPGGTVITGPTPTNCTKVTVIGTGGTYTYYKTYDGLMNDTGDTDGNGQRLVTKTYADLYDPYEPSTVTLATGVSWSMQWDQFGRPLLVTSNRQVTSSPVTYHKTAYTYSASTYNSDGTIDDAIMGLSSIQHDDRPAVYFTYSGDDEHGSVPPNLVSSVEYEHPDSVHGVTSTLSQTTTFKHDALGNVIKIEQPAQLNSGGAMVYNDVYFDYTIGGPEMLGKPYKITDKLGKYTTLSYDSFDNVISAVDPLGNNTQYSYNLLNLPTVIAAPATGQTGSVSSTIQINRAFPDADPYSEIIRDEGSNIVRQLSMTYGPEGEVLQKTGDSEALQSSYDMLYRPTTVTDGNGNVTRYFYNPAGYLYQIMYPGAGAATATVPATPGSGDTLTYTAYDLIGDVTSMKDGRGNVTNYAYADPEGYLTSVTYPGSPLNNTTYTYDGYGRLASTYDTGTTIGYTYDDINELLSTTTQYNGLPAKTVSYTHYYDGARSQMISPYGATSYNYDGDRRLSSMTDPFGVSSSWTYLDNGWLSTELAGGQVTRTYTYWPDGSTKGVKSMQGTTTLANFTSMMHDGAGKLKSMNASVPPLFGSVNNGHYAYNYDTAGRLTQETWNAPASRGVLLNGTTDYVQAVNSAVGNVGTGDFTVSAWIKITGLNGTNQNVVAKRGVTGNSSFYDLYVTNSGYLAAEVCSNTSGANYLSYQETTKIVNNSAWHQVAMVRHADVISLYVDGALAGSSPTGTGVGTANLSNSSPLVFGSLLPYGTTYSMKGIGDELRLYPRALTAAEITSLYAGTHAVDPPVGAQLYWGFEAFSGTTVCDSSGYGQDGTLVGTATINSGCPTTGYTTNYAYDGGVTGGAGNLTTYGETTNGFNLDNFIGIAAGDGNGNATTYRGMGLSYDVENELTSAPGLTVTYRPDGLRASQTDAGGTTYYLYDGSYPIEQMNASGGLGVHQEYGAGGYLGHYDSGQFNTYAFDPMGNSILTVGYSQITNATQYPLGAYGVVGGTSVPSGYYGMQHNFNYAWNGGQSGLIGLGARLYDPQAGRFVNRDPIGYGGGMNVFGYAGGDPINNADPSGLAPSMGAVYNMDRQASMDALDGASGGYGGAYNRAYNQWDINYHASLAAGEHFANTMLFVLPGIGEIGGATEAAAGGIEAVEGTECAVASKTCFVAGTPVQMAGGSTKPIDKIKLGDHVLSRDTKTGKDSSKRVEGVLIKHDVRLLTLHFVALTSGQEQDRIVCTPDHPFYVVSKGFVPAGKLVVGDAVAARTGPALTISKIDKQTLAHSVPVYNLTIEGNHTYFVGKAEGGEWVHNYDVTPHDWDGNFADLQEHFGFHGRDFGAANEEDYARMANDFWNQSGTAGMKIKIGPDDGLFRLYHPPTNTFGTYTPFGKTVTFYKPVRGINYWIDQAGTEFSP